MQTDFHHATTYVVARAAGFDHKEADIIAYASQYVDDATSEGTVYFDNRAVYNRTSSAHRTLDPRNTKSLANHQAWLAFHFLPGNGGREAGEDPPGTENSFIHKIICTKNSPIAQEMVRTVIQEKEKRYGLHRLGVAMHVYVDTWAHQGFAGVMHEINEVEDAEEIGGSNVFGKLKDYLWDKVEDVVPPLGHGRANVLPDMPFMKWQYYNGKGELVKRDNTKDFMEAAEHMCIAMRRFRLGDPDAGVEGLDGATKEQIESLFIGLTRKDSDIRHKEWLKAIRDGAFTKFGAADIAQYESRGRNSWKEHALGTSHDLPVHRYKEGFLDSNWKLFHDAIQAHRFNVVHDILPKYGICAA